MRSKAVLASFVTISMMSLFILMLVSPVLIAGFSGMGEGGGSVLVGFALSVAVTVLIAVLMWLVSPFLMDLVNRWAYRCRDMSIEELGQHRPNVAGFVHHVCQKHGIELPRLKLIDDMNPTAYCYGSYANNSRLVVTRGLLHYLDDEELKAVYAHELGHIIHRDFIVMTIAATLLSILWQIYIAARSMKSRNSKDNGAALLFAVVAYVFWWISQYLLLYLSRAREYYADEFAAEETGNPNALSMALVKIAYGIARQPSTDFSKKLLGGTRSLGVADPRAAGSTGYAFAAANNAGHQMAGAIAGQNVGDIAVTAESVSRIEKVFLFDLFNPWAKVLELGSTHPLTGKRIRELCGQAARMNQQPMFQFQPIDAYGRQLDHGRLYGNFVLELVVWFAPQGLAALFVVLGLVGGIAGSGALAGLGFGGILLGYGAGATLRGFYKFPGLGEPALTSVLELMMDPYASPLRGRPVTVQGVLIGRADAGGRFGEDMMMEDTQGGLIMLNYESPIPIVGNAWFGWRTVGGLVGQGVQARGWFRRGISQQIDLKDMRSQAGETIDSWTAFWGRAGGIVLLLLGILVAAGAAAAASSTSSSSTVLPMGTTSTSQGYETPMQGGGK